MTDYESILFGLIVFVFVRVWLINEASQETITIRQWEQRLIPSTDWGRIKTRKALKISRDTRTNNGVFFRQRLRNKKTDDIKKATGGA